MTTHFPFALWLSLVLIACARPDKARQDSMAEDSARAAAAHDIIPAPRVVPYNPSTPGAMRSGDTPIHAAPAPPARTTAPPAPRAQAPAPRTSMSPAPADSIGDPVAVVRDYYSAIRAHDFLRAYRMWETSGQRNVRSFAQFEAGFDSTETVDVKTRAPGRVEGAAGSRFVTVPVEIDSRLRNGTRQKFSGTYTLRRVVVPGASPAQRQWHLYAANIRQVQ